MIHQNIYQKFFLFKKLFTSIDNEKDTFDNITEKNAFNKCLLISLLKFLEYYIINVEKS